MIRSISATSLLLGGLAALVVGVWLALDNPEIDGTSKGDGYPCLAPWDTVVAGADNVPGGEPPRDADEIADRCVAAGRLRFTEAAATGLAGGVLVVVAAVRRRGPASS